jgi:hypothetical protein
MCLVELIVLLDSLGGSQCQLLGDVHSFRLKASLELTCGALVNPNRHQSVSKGRACFIQLFAVKK